MLSIICPIYNEKKYIVKCLDSILLQDYPKDDLEVIFVDGMSTDGTREIINEYISKYDFIKMYDNPKRIAPCAMNIGIQVSQGEVLMRIDGHSLYPTNYFSSLVYWLNVLPNASNVGAVCDTEVLNKNITSVSIAKVMSDKIGVGNSTFRTGSNDEFVEVDTVPFGCYKREVFDQIGLYNEALVRCQDIELNKRLTRAGGKIYLIPSVRCSYIPRDNYSDFAKNRYLTGYWVLKSSFICKTFKNLGLRHFIPLLFVLSVITTLVAGLLSWPFFVLTGLAIFSYVILISARSVMIVDANTRVLNLIWAFTTLHISYGWGSICAILDQILNLRKN